MTRFAAALLILVASPLVAQSGKRPDPPISLTETSVRLALDGAARGNPRAIMAAAQILRVVERGTPRVERVGPPLGPDGPWEGPLTSEALLRLASTIAADSGDWATADYAAWLLQLPDSVPITRGAVGGPIWADAYLGRGQAVSYTIHFGGGQTPNQLHISAAKAGAVVECVLLEADDPDRVAARVRSRAGTCAMEWRQATARRMTLRITNGGPATYFVVSSN